MNDTGIKLSLEQISKDVGSLTQNMTAISAQVEAVKKQIEPLVEIYDGALFARKFAIGLAAFIIAIGAIGGGVLWFVDWIRHG